MSHAKHIIVAEAQPIFRRLTEIILWPAKIHKITEADNYDETLALLRAGKVDLLILDYEINGVCGTPYIRRIRDDRANRNRHVPIITLYDAQNDEWMESYVMGQALNAGATACVSKPLSIKKLFPIIANALDLECMAGAYRHPYHPQRAPRLWLTPA